MIERFIVTCAECVCVFFFRCYLFFLVKLINGGIKGFECIYAREVGQVGSNQGCVIESIEANSLFKEYGVPKGQRGKSLI